VKAIPLPLFPQIESLYRAALSKTESDAQRQRLQMFGHNLVLLHWNLCQAGWLEKPELSSFNRSDADFRTFVEQSCALSSISKTNATPELFLKPQLSGDQVNVPSVDRCVSLNRIGTSSA